ncbi:MAG: glycosyltransferase, partial [Candidatus Omnitrophica bacterium]|nr:glycosyltransferase [Candidatus Omnitrophota bacterium]
MDKVKVLHIITRLINGGAQKNTLLTINGLKKEGYDARLAYGFTSGDEGELITTAKGMGVDLYYIPQMKREISPINDIRAFLKLYKLIKKEGFDIVHTHTSKAGILGRFSAKLAGVPVIIHSPHGHIFHPEADIRGVSKGILGI